MQGIFQRSKHVHFIQVFLFYSSHMFSKLEFGSEPHLVVKR